MGKLITKKTAGSYFMITLGAFIYSVGQVVFIRSLNIPLGGITGIAMIINYLTNLPVGVMNLVMNVPLLFLAFRIMGRRYFAQTIYAVVLFSVFMDIGQLILPEYLGDVLVNAIFGGVLMGFGTGLVYRQGGMGGGTDIIAKYVNKKRDVRIGNFLFALNTVIILISAFVYKSLSSALYAMITTFLTNAVIDKIVYGFDVQKKALIVTDKPEEVAESVMKRLGKGITAWKGKGMYSGSERTILLCAVHRHETGVLKQTLKEVDPRALLMLSEMTEVFGMDFKNYDNQ